MILHPRLASLFDNILYLRVLVLSLIKSPIQVCAIVGKTVKVAERQVKQYLKYEFNKKLVQ